MMEARGVAQRQRAWFGTRRSAVQIRPPRPRGMGRWPAQGTMLPMPTYPFRLANALTALYPLDHQLQFPANAYGRRRLN